MNKLSIYFFSFCFIALIGNNAFAQSGGEVTENQKKLIEEQVLKPIRIIHDSAKFFKAFANAYTISSIWKYEMENSPGKKNKYYGFVLREYMGAFIIDQYKFKLYEQEERIEMEEWETGKFIDVNTWLRQYKKLKQK